MRRVQRFWLGLGDGMQLTVDSGQLPVGWEIKTLDELCYIARGGSPRPIKSALRLLELTSLRQLFSILMPAFQIVLLVL